MSVTPSRRLPPTGGAFFEQTILQHNVTTDNEGRKRNRARILLVRAMVDPCPVPEVALSALGFDVKCTDTACEAVEWISHLTVDALTELLDAHYLPGAGSGYLLREVGD